MNSVELYFSWASEMQSDAVSTVSPSISHEVMGLDTMIFVLWMWSFKASFSLSSLEKE